LMLNEAATRQFCRAPVLDLVRTFYPYLNHPSPLSPI
jgi:hypothetical protein